MKTVLVTGANRGLGLGFVRSYLADGWSVLGAARTPGRSAELLALEAEYGTRLVPVELDVTSEASVSHLLTVLSARGVALDVVINNAGVSVDEGLGHWTAASFETSFLVNAIGPALVAQAVVPFMNAGSRLIMISSGVGSSELNINPCAGLDAYAMSKAALNILTRRLASKLSARGIAVIALNPGWVRTDMGGGEAPASVSEAIEAMTAMIESVAPSASGRFIGEDGVPLPW